MSPESWQTHYHQLAHTLTKPERIVLTSLALEANRRTGELRLNAGLEERICAFGSIGPNEVRACVRGLTSRGWLEAGEWDGGAEMPIRLRVPQETSEASP